MNWEFIGKYLPLYERAAVLTVKIGLIGIAFAILVGLLCAAIQYYKVPVARQIVAVYVEISRNTPLLVQLFFIYYGFPKIGIRLTPDVCGVIGLAFLGGSYMAEAFRSGLESIEPIQKEGYAVEVEGDIAVIIDTNITPELEEEAIKAIIEKFSGIITANGGEIESVDEWGKRRLAYPIDYKTEGYYVLTTFSAAPEFPRELERNFNNDENILRYLVVRKEA